MTMKQTGIPEVPTDLVILPTAPYNSVLEGIKVQVRGIDELGFPFDIRTLESAVPRDVEDQTELATRIGKLVENTVRHLMGLKVEGAS